MGQKGSKLDVEESCLKPHHPHKCTDVDLKKLKALIKQGKLAPCFPPEEEENDELEECPICFLAYPALNNTRCCRKGICTECFLQVKLPNGHRGGALCPFCKSEFSVFFKGPRTDEERQESQAEEKRVAEATIRARQAEEARGEARASKLRQERLDNSPQASSKALAQREGSDAAAMPSPSAPPAPSNSVPPRGHIDEEALRAVLASLDMSEYIPHQIRSPTTSDLEDAMLQQAIQASLRDQEFPEFSFGSMQSGVLPDAVAFSPQPSQGLPPQEEAERADSSTGASGRHAEGGEVWEEVDLGQRRPSSRLAQSSVPLAATSNPQPSFEEEASSSGQAEQATPRAQAENSEGPSEQGVVERSNGAAVGVTEGSPKQPAPSPHRTPGFNALSTISSCTMETLLFDQQDNLLDTRLLDTRASMGDLLATPSSPSYPCQQLLPTPAAEAASQALPVPATASMAAPSDKPAGESADYVSPEVPAPASTRAEGEGEPGVSSSPRKPEAAEESAHATQEGGLPACSSREVSGAEGRVQLGITAEESSAEIPAVPEPHAATESAGAAAEAAKSPSSETATSRKAAEAEEVVHEIAEVSEATPPPTLAEPAAAVESSGTKSEDVQSFAPSTTAASPCHSSDTAATAEPAMIPAESAEEAGPSPGESGIAEAAGGVQEEGVGSASQGHVDGSRGWSSRRSSASSLEERGVDTPRPEGESEAPASWRRRSRHGGARSGVHRLAQSCEPQAGLGALAAAEDGVSGLTIECSNEQEGEPDVPRTPRDMGLRRHSSGASSNDELIGALHSYAASPGASERSPLPAPPKHLKAFLSGGKRFASPLSARGRALASSPKDDPKGPSFADLLNSKGRSSNRSLSARRAREKSSVFAPPSALTVGVALVDSQPSEGLAGATAGAEAPLPNGGAAGEATASGAGGSLSAQRTLAYGEPSGQTAQGRVIYEEPGSSGALALARDGGAVLLTQPDGSTQLVLLTPDQQRQVVAAEAWKAENPAPESQTYSAPGDPLDLQMRERLDKADAAMRQLYLTLQAGNAASSGSGNIDMGGSSTVVDSFTEKLREQDERFRAAMEGMAAETGIREAPDRDAADDALKALIDKQDRLQASH